VEFEELKEQVKKQPEEKEKASDVDLL